MKSSWYRVRKPLHLLGGVLKAVFDAFVILASGTAAALIRPRSRRPTPEYRRMSAGRQRHRPGVVVVTPEGVGHRVVGCQGVRPRHGRREMIVGAIEKHSGMGHAILAKRTICHRLLAGVRPRQAMQVIIVPRNPLAFLPQRASPIIPAAQPMRDHDLVPEGARCLDGGDVRDRQVQPGQVIGDIGPDDRQFVWIERRLGSGLDPHDWSHIGAIAWSTSG